MREIVVVFDNTWMMKRRWTSRGQQTQSNIYHQVPLLIVHWCARSTLIIKLCLPTLFRLALCPPAAAPLHDLCDRVDPPLPDEDRREEVHPAGDLSEVLQDMGEQMEDRAEEELPPRTSPPQVPPKVLTQLSIGDGECSKKNRRSMFWVEEINKI